ncbi:hypothetical protein Acr_11g0012020 [Actinidia rufa]|uniref:Uncharacterized protein n=1 Tax=Actinidia rufa TaxID=165716 RepID=A0A7J0FEP2_9ERIC|nr:hypothetical protein Acr_11g0012020 [Actinidia rufa]
MGVMAVLHPQDCLGKQPQTLTKPPRNPNRSNHRKRSPPENNNKSRQTMVDNFPAKNLVMGQVKILKRGEELTVMTNRGSEKSPKKDDKDFDDLVLSSISRLGPEPEMVPKQLRLGDNYAGLGFVGSPPPSSLPLPAFLSKKK